MLHLKKDKKELHEKNNLTYREVFKKKKANKKTWVTARGLGKGEILVLNGYRVSVEEEERSFGEGSGSGYSPV